jgi:hypothetical protein
MASPARDTPEDQGSGHYEEAEPYNSAALVLLTSPIEGSANEEKGDGNTGSNVEWIDPLHAAYLRRPCAVVKSVKSSAGATRVMTMCAARKEQSQINGLVQSQSTALSKRSEKRLSKG